MNISKIFENNSFRVKQGFSYDILSVLFKVSPFCASSTYEDVLMNLFMKNKYILTLWNDNIPDHVVTEFLLRVRDQQSPSVRFNMDGIRTSGGMPVIAVCIDATHFNTEKSSDAFLQMGRFSGRRVKGHCVLQTTLTDPNGSVLAIAPGIATYYFISCR